MLPRPVQLAQLLQRLGQFPVVAFLGARQIGKTTLARQLAASWDGPVKHFDLEDPDDQARLADPAFALRPLTGLVVLDEIQTRPDLFPLLRVFADCPETPAHFLILGSASLELLRRAARVWQAASPIRAFCTVFWGSPMPTLARPSQVWRLLGRTDCARDHSSQRRTSGPKPISWVSIPAPNWTCSSSGMARAWALKSSSLAPQRSPP